MATAANQATANQSLASMDTKLPSKGQAALVAAASGYSVPAASMLHFSNVIYAGDSLTAAAWSTYPAWQNASMRPSKYTNVAAYGKTIEQVLSQQAPLIDATYDAGYYKNIAVILGGTNNRTGQSTMSAADIYANIETLCNARKAAGFKVVLCTIPAISGGDAKIDAVNVLIRAGSCYDALADLAGDARLYPWSSTYYADAVHMKRAGYVVLAELVNAAILTLA